jgi:hypothetical protein
LGKLTQVPSALHRAGRLTNRSDSRDQQRHQDRDDGDHDQELHERKTAAQR